MKRGTAVQKRFVAISPQAIMACAALMLSHGTLADTSSYYAYDTDYTTYSDSSSTGPVSHNYPRLGGDTSAYADYATQTIRAYARADSNDSDGYQSGDLKDAKSSAGFTRTFVVNAGTSGLAVGDPVTVRFNMALSGSLRTGFIQECPSGFCSYAQSPNYYWLTTIDVSASYRLTDPTRLVCDGEGCFSDQLLNFGYDARSTSAGQDGAYNVANKPVWWLDTYDPDRDGMRDWSDQLGWTLNGNLGGDLSGGFDLYDSCPDVSCVGRFVIGAPPGLDFGTGPLSIDFQTYVGSQILAKADLDIFPQAYGLNYPAGAIGDYLGTFNGELVPVTEGIVLTSLDTTLVPVPAAVWLFGSGLLGLIGVARRKTGGKKISPA